jgi:site-specific recombinase XerD
MRRKSKLRDTQRRYLERIALTLRPDTVINARSATDRFIRYLEEAFPRISCFSQLQRQHIEDWLRYLAQRRLKRSSRGDHIIKVRRFLQTLEDWRWEEAPRAELFRRGDIPPKDRGLPRPLSHQTDRVLQRELRRRKGIIYKALLLMRSTGVRRKECLDLKVDSLRSLPRGQWVLHVPLGKLHNERVLPLDRETAKIFQEIRRLRGSPPPVTDPDTGKPAHFLIVRPDGRRFCRDVFRYFFEKIEKEARLEEHLTPHRLRHTFATEMLRAGASLPVVMRLLGHRSIAMTLRYAEVSGVDVRRAYFETIPSIEKRYEVPSLPAIPPRSTRKLTSWHAVASHLEAVAGGVESLRRDRRQKSDAKRVQRLIERLRRIARDFDRLES